MRELSPDDTLYDPSLTAGFIMYTLADEIAVRHRTLFALVLAPVAAYRAYQAGRFSRRECDRPEVRRHLWW